MKNRTMVNGIPVDRLTGAEADGILRHLAVSGRSAAVCSVNFAILRRAGWDDHLRRILLDAAVCLCDGIGVSLLALFEGKPPFRRVTGIDCAERLMKFAALRSIPVAFLGGCPGVARRAADRMMGRYPRLRVVATLYGYYPKEREMEVCRRLAASGAAIVLVCMGAPRQEYFIRDFGGAISPRLFLPLGGTFDVWSGKVKRCPIWLQNLGLEWAYRTVVKWGQRMTFSGV